ncbi:MAG: hypothetical protein CVV46_11475 [Spirochaetae bacterium HGW-Spirochaetae-2]|jgi:kynurenine formamidase|nr:MAG: hypothetical protein CVV46_11475 [Spirochaetae bacterium HGW-Spirochaetae-2]
MYRIIDLSIRPNHAPVGNGQALLTPSVSSSPVAEMLREPVTKERTLNEILSYYEFNHMMSGVQAGEIFTKGILTTKPYTTYATYLNTQSVSNGRPEHLADLDSDYLVGAYTLIDLTGMVKNGSTITAEMLKKVVGDKDLNRIVVIRTDYSKNRPAKPSESYLKESPTLSVDAAEYLISKGIYSLVIDVRSINPILTGKSKDQISALLNSSGILVVEDACDLENVVATYDLAIIGFPLPVKGITGGPSRVFFIHMSNPTDFLDCTHPLESYPDNPYDYELPFEPPISKRALDEIGDYPNVLPGRIEPRELQGITMKTSRLTPFAVVDEHNNVITREMYMEYGHGTGTHIESAFYDPWGRHCVPEEVLKRYVRIPKDRLVGRACLLDLSNVVGPNQLIDSTHLKDADPGLEPGDIAVIRADFADWFFYGTIPTSGPGLTPDAAVYLVKKGIRALVCDFAVEKSDPVSNSPAIKYTPNKVHYYLHKNDVPIVEWACNMKLLKKKKFIVAVLPLPASHQGGFPSHVFAIEEWR